MATPEQRSDRRALLVAGIGGLFLLGLPSAVELAPWRRGGMVPGPGGELVLTAAGPPFLAWLALVILVATLVPGALALVVILRAHVIEWPRGRRAAALAVLALCVGLVRTIAVAGALPGVVPGTITVAEILLSSVEAVIAFALATYYVDTRRRIRAEERRRLAEAEHAARVQIELEEEELRVRREVARTLHGGLQQRLVIAVSELEAIRSGLEARGEAAAAQSVGGVTEALDQVREDDVRALAHALYPLAADIDLSAALLLLADQLPASVRMDTHHETGAALVTGSSLPVTDRTMLFSIVEEGVSNAVRHGKPRAIRVTIGADHSADASRLTAHVSIDDDGVGLGSNTPVLSGLARLRARVRRRGGDLTLGPSALGGARLAARVPVGTSAHGETTSNTDSTDGMG